MSEQLVQLDPAKVLADDNSRFNLKRLRIDSLAANILETGGVLTPVEVEPLVPAQNGFTHRLTSGFYRHAAVSKLNAEQQAGLTLPAIVREISGDELMRLRHQVSENIERENMSPMDQAIAADRLLSAGVARSEVRRIFARPSGRKGLVSTPLSNAMLNIMLRFLELPKAIQEKIHDGRVGVAAAYELGKVPPEKRAAVLESAEKERIAQIDREEKDEERHLKAEKKLTEAQEEAKQAVSSVAEAKNAIVAAKVTVEEKKAALKEVQSIPFLTLDDKGKKETTEKLKASLADVKAAEKLEKDAQNELAKLLTKQKTAEEKAAEHKASLDAARKAVKPAGKKANKGQVGPEDVKKAAKKEGVDTGYVPLSASDMRQAVKDIQNNKDYPKVGQLGKVIREMFDGKWSAKEVIYGLAILTGEEKKKPAPGSLIPGQTEATPAAAPAKK